MNPDSPQFRPPFRPVSSSLLAMGPLLLLGLLAILTGRIPGRVHYDQALYHEPVVRQFLSQWPAFDFYDYLSATTPGYHLLLAAAGRLVGPSTILFQSVSLAIGCGLVATLGWWAGRRLPPITAAILCWPLATSIYVFQSAGYLLPDNLAWWGVALLLLLAMHANNLFHLLCMSIVLLGLTFVRQIHFWTAGLLIAGGWLLPISADEPWLGSALIARWRSRLGPIVFAAGCTLPAAFLLWQFVTMWGGLVPPRFQQQYATGFNLASVPFTLSIIAVLGPFSLPIFWPHLLRSLRHQRSIVLLTLLAGAAVAIVAPTEFNYAAGRRGGLWSIAAKMPTLLGRTSPLVVALSALGTVFLGSWISALRGKERIVALAALLGFCLALGAGVELWQRYAEPFLLILTTIFSVRLIQAERHDAARFPTGWDRRWTLTGPLLLTAIFTAANLASLQTPVRVSDPAPPAKSPGDTSQIPAPIDIVPPPPTHGRGLWW